MPQGDFGFNGKISAPGFGARRIRVVQLRFGLGIIATSNEEARDRRGFYSIVTVGSSFTMGVSFVSWEEREAFNQWARNFMESLASGTAKSGFMTISCPARDFYRTAVPDNELVYGKGVTDVGYTTQMSFLGAHNPLDLSLKSKMAGISYFRLPKTTSAEHRYFYPAGRQVSGAESLDGTVYDPSQTAGSANFDWEDKPGQDLPEVL